MSIMTSRKNMKELSYSNVISTSVGNVKTTGKSEFLSPEIAQQHFQKLSNPNENKTYYSYWMCRLQMMMERGVELYYNPTNKLFALSNRKQLFTPNGKVINSDGFYNWEWYRHNEEDARQISVLIEDWTQNPGRDCCYNY